MYRKLLLSMFYLCCYALPLAAQDSRYTFLDIDSIKEANGLTLAIRRIGAQRTRPEARAILLIHGGGPGGVASFNLTSNSFADSLALKDFIVYIMDIRGWDNSTAPAYNVNDTSLVAGSCVEAAEDIDAVIDQIRQREHVARVSLFGWAAGGHWASYYTTLHNDKVDHLIVLNTLYGVQGPWSYNSSFADPTDSARYDSRIPVYRVSDRDAIIAARLAAIPYSDKTPWIGHEDLTVYAMCVANDSGDLNLHVPGGYRRESFYMAHGYQYWKASDIRVPTLIVRSQYDQWSRPIDVPAFYNDLVNAPRRDTLELRNATHFVTIDQPQQGRSILVDAIDRFIPSPPPSRLIIDSLKTDAQILQFVRSFDGVYTGLYIDPPGPLRGDPASDLPWRRQFGASAWEKGDFDNNGRTDLVFNGYLLNSPNSHAQRIGLVVLGLGPDSFRIVQLTTGIFQGFFAAKKFRSNGHDNIVALQPVRRYAVSTDTNALPKRIDTLSFEFDHFIERPRAHKPYSIQSISYSTGGGMTIDLGYHLTVRGDSIWMLREEFNDLATDIIRHYFKAHLDPADSHDFYQLLDHLDLPSLKGNYEVPWTDDGTAVVNLHFAAGKLKQIVDYGGIGTYGLIALYDMLTKFRHSLNWTPCAIPNRHKVHFAP